MCDELRDLVDDILLLFEDVDVEELHETMQTEGYEAGLDKLGLTESQTEAIARNWHARAHSILSRSNR